MSSVFFLGLSKFQQGLQIEGQIVNVQKGHYSGMMYTVINILASFSMYIIWVKLYGLCLVMVEKL